MKSIFVGNLDYGASEEAIRALFENYGPVDRVKIMTDRETGRSRGFAFVEMANADQADQAIAALNGADMNGRPLNVSEARPRPERSPRPSGGGFRGAGGGGPRSERPPRREPRW